jgi:hypothetical protein
MCGSVPVRRMLFRALITQDNYNSYPDTLFSADPVDVSTHSDPI